MNLVSVISGFYEEVSTFLRGNGIEDLADGVANGVDGSFGSLAQQVFELGEELFDGVEVGRIFGQENELSAGVADSLAYGLAFMATEIVDDDDVAGLERGNEDLLYVDQEPLAVDRTVDQPGCLDPIVAQRGQEGHGLPVTVRRLRPEPLSARRPAPERRHVCLGPGLVDEDQTGRINPALILPPLRPTSRDVGTILFAGEHGFF